MKKLLFFVLLLCLRAESADYCEPLRMDSPGGSMEHVRLHNQGDHNICGYNTLAQMMDAYRHTENAEKDSHVTSPLAMGIQRNSISVDSDFHSINREFFFEGGGSICRRFDIMKEAGVGSCDEASFIKALTKNTALKSTLLSKVFRRVSDEVRLDYGLGGVKHYIKKIEDCDLHPEVRVGDNIFYFANEMRTALKRMGGDQKLKDLAKQTCRGENAKPLNMTCESEYENLKKNNFVDQEYALDALHSYMQGEKPQPVALIMCAEALLKNKTSMRVSNKRLANCSSHSLVAMGRRRNSSGKCQVLLRNSTLLNCKGYANPRDCEDGGNTYWMDEDKLAGNIIDVARFKK